MTRSKTQKSSVPTQPFIPDPPERELGDDLFSRNFKNWREWQNAVNFLTNLHIGVDEAQVFCSPKDPPDVIFQDAAFEIKEIMDEGRCRHDEVKQARQESRQTKLNFTSRPVIDLLPIDAGQLVLAQLGTLAGKYHEVVKGQTDLLFYINKLDHWFDDGPMPNAALFAQYGWRSVSALIASDVSIVFYANNSAPQFLIKNTGKVRQRFEPL
mgnify:FL=1|jgi:hypothetical protein